ncbi:hypothetical protein cypCar_00016576 [Cyprinus carpio]|nr:hypothetical protein cypCar_00016576 [Cyprinus carpio]
MSHRCPDPACGCCGNILGWFVNEKIQVKRCGRGSALLHHLLHGLPSPPPPFRHKVRQCPCGRAHCVLQWVFHNCSCVLTPSPVEGSRSVSPGQCHRGPGCTRSFTSYMAVSVLSSFINSLGTTPGYMIIIRCITPELKSLALGIQTLVMRTLGGIPAPVYFGALIDSTCLKWGIRSCGGRGACRMYDSNMYRVIFLSLTTCLSGCSYFFIIAVIVLLRKQFRKEEIKALQQTDSKQNETELQSPEMCHPDASNTDTSPREKTESANTEC